MRVFIQNKPNFKIGKMNATFFTTNPYANEQRTMNNQTPSKQTQYKPKQTQFAGFSNERK